jgi:hypothetical protein
MPGFDGTGPRGMGPMTGGGRGFCSPWGIGAALSSGVVPPYLRVPYPYGSPGAIPPYRGYAPYGGPGAMPFYRGYAPGTAPGQSPATPGATPYAPQMAPEQELDYLKDQARMMREQLERIDARIRELGTEK